MIFKGATLKDSGPDQKIPGVKVVTTEENSEASRLGLIEGDIIVAVNKIPVKNQLQLSDALKKAKNMQALNIVRDHRRMYIIVK